MKINRREFLSFCGLGAAALSLGADFPARTNAKEMKEMARELPKLPYDYNALEPHYSEETLRLHHDKHHASYVQGLNAAEEKMGQMLNSGDFSDAKSVCKNLAYHGSGHILHSIFWTNMKPKGGGQPGGELARQIDKDFGNFEAFKGFFLAAANGVEGSGWGILAYRGMDDALVVLQAEKHQDLTQWGVTPIMVVDVWEHAYYLMHQNKRPEWTKSFIENLVNWDDAAARLAAARK